MVTNSTVADNNAEGAGGGIANYGTLTITNSTVAGDSASGSGGGIENAFGALTVANSTIADNSASRSGGGIDNGGTLTVTNSTVADNNADGGGGIDNDGALAITNSTIASNNATSGGMGGGLLVSSGTPTLNNTIVALNTSGVGNSTTPDDISLDGVGPLSPLNSNNLIGTGGSGGLTNGINGNQVGVANPGLDPNGLEDNGGPTQTIALLSDSPAIDAGSNALAVDPQGNPLTTDQRGSGYPRIVHGDVDIGAFEFTGTFVVVTAQPPGSVAAGSGFGLTVAAEDSSGTVDSSFDGTVTVALDNNPGGSVLGGTLTATAQNGVATFADLTLEKAGVGYMLRVSSTGLAGATTNAFDVTPLAATQLVVTAQPPSSVTVGLGFGLTVAAEDQFDNVDTNFGGSVTVALLNNPGGATLGGALSVTAQSGVATFSGLTLNVIGTGYTLQVSSNGLTGATTDAFNVYLATVYTVDLTSASGAGSGNAGDLVYTIGLANANTTPGGSIIQFDPTVFASPQTITLANTLVLSETAGPEVIDGPGASLVTVSGGGAVEVFSVTSGVTASLTGLTISGGLATQGGGLSVVGGTVSLTKVAVINNQAVGAKGAGGGFYQPGGDGGSGQGGGIYLNGGSLTLTDDTIGSNVARGGTGGNAGFTSSNFGSFGTGDGGPADGGGLYVADGTLVLNNDVFKSNQAIGGAEGKASPEGGMGAAAVEDRRPAAASMWLVETLS